MIHYFIPYNYFEINENKKFPYRCLIYLNKSLDNAHIFYIKKVFFCYVNLHTKSHINLIKNKHLFLDWRQKWNVGERENFHVSLSQRKKRARDKEENNIFSNANWPLIQHRNTHILLFSSKNQQYLIYFARKTNRCWRRRLSRRWMCAWFVGQLAREVWWSRRIFLCRRLWKFMLMDCRFE